MSTVIANAKPKTFIKEQSMARKMKDTPSFQSSSNQIPLSKLSRASMQGKYMHQEK